MHPLTGWVLTEYAEVVQNEGLRKAACLDQEADHAPTGFANGNKEHYHFIYRHVRRQEDPE